MRTVSICTLLIPVLWCIPSHTWAQEDARATMEDGGWKMAELPAEGSVAELRQFIDATKKLQPKTIDQYLEMQKGIRDASQRLMKLIKKQDSDQFQAAEMDFISSSVMLLGNKGEESQKKTFERFRDYLQSKTKLVSNDLQMALLAGQNLEQLDDLSLAKEAYESFSKILEEKKEASYEPIIKLMRASIRRLELPGKELELQGKTNNDEEFNLTSFRGKIALVYVWATWSPPCIEEFPYMQRLYETYHPLGFEIVGICIDDEKSSMEKFLNDNKVPWKTLWDATVPRSHPFTEELGISAVPTMILVDREGKVISLEARGSVLGNALEKILGL